jgi:hypothetical protein
MAETSTADKFLEVIKDKISKKQIVAVIGIIAIGWKVDATPEWQCVCIGIIVAMNHITQGIYDHFKKGEKNGKENDVPIVPAGG